MSEPMNKQGVHKLSELDERRKLYYRILDIMGEKLGQAIDERRDPESRKHRKLQRLLQQGRKLNI